MHRSNRKRNCRRPAIHPCPGLQFHVRADPVGPQGGSRPRRGRGSDCRQDLGPGQSKSGSRYSAATYLGNAGIPVWVDTKVAIAHNKVMVIDGATVITGSFNFTAAAQNSMPRICLCSMTRRWRRSTRRIGSAGGQCRCAMAARWKAASRPQNRRTHTRRSTGLSCGPMPPSTCRHSDVRIPTAASDNPGRPAELSEAPRSSLLRRRAGTGRPSARGVPSGRRAEGRRIPLLTAPGSSQAASISRRRRRSRMLRTCWCSMIRRWRQSTRPIGSGGGRCRRLMWVRCHRQRRSGRIAAQGFGTGRWRARLRRALHQRGAEQAVNPGEAGYPSCTCLWCRDVLRLRENCDKRLCSGRCCPGSSGP